MVYWMHLFQGTTMPNKRDEDKKQVAFWLSPKEREELEEAARLYGLNMTELVKKAIRKMLLEGKANDGSNRKDPRHD